MHGCIIANLHAAVYACCADSSPGVCCAVASGVERCDSLSDSVITPEYNNASYGALCERLGGLVSGGKWRASYYDARLVRPGLLWRTLHEDPHR